MTVENPFEVTKAVDFSDAEIASTWVDLPGGGFTTLASPTSPMNRFLAGGKGGGRTHLLRYYSYPLQRLRHQPSVIDGVTKDGYIGVYFRCAGLNSGRFSGKGESIEVWASTFAFYTDLWLAQLVIEAVTDLLNLASGSRQSEARDFVNRILELFDEPPSVDLAAQAIPELIRVLRVMQRTLDAAINNAALRRSLEVRITSSPGRLVFGVPQAAAASFPELAGVRFAYLVDEFENLTEPQQMYINTLLREKELPSTFLVGSRLWGLRTHFTFSAEEENKQGSEFDLVILEDAYREKSHRYESFCTDIVRSRLATFGAYGGVDVSPSALFELPKGSSLEERAKHHIDDFGEGERPWILALRRLLLEQELPDDQQSAVVAAVEARDHPLAERFALFMLFRAWSDGRSLEESVEYARDARECVSVENLATVKNATATTYRHYRSDLYAQLLRDLGKRQEYFGLSAFIRMSGYLPRNLLIVLKQITRWSLFLDEDPFRKGGLSLAAQSNGVREASSWFLEDSKGLGRLGIDTEVAIRRLGEYLQAHRFAPKPVEVECVAFESTSDGMTTEATLCLDEAVKHSFLLEIRGGRRDKNTGAFHRKYQLNPMLAPLFDLPLARRGVAKYSPTELNIIFEPGTTDLEFARMRDARVSTLSPLPRVGRAAQQNQETLGF